MEDKKIMNHASLNDSELEAVSGGTNELKKWKRIPTLLAASAAGICSQPE